jgi:hypothetical protein
VDHVEPGKIFYTSQELLEESAGFWFFYSLMLNDVVKEFSTRSELHY